MLKISTFLKLNMLLTMTLFIIVFVVFLNVNRTSDDIFDLEQNYYELDEMLDSLGILRLKQHKLVLDHVINNEINSLPEYISEHEKSQNILLALLDTSKEKIHLNSDEITKIASVLLQKNEQLLELSKNVLSLGSSVKEKSTLNHKTIFIQSMDKYRNNSQSFVTLVINAKNTLVIQLQLKNKKLTQRHKEAIHQLIFSGCLIVLLIVFSFYFLTVNLANPISVITKNMSRLAPTVQRKSKVREVTILNQTYNQVLIDLNIYQKKLIEEKLKSEEMSALADKANEAKGLFIASVNHELRSPLNVISVSISLLEQGHGLNSDLLEDMKIANHMMLSVINDVLDYSKISAGKMQTTISEVSIETIIDEIITHNKVLFKSKEVKFYVSAKGKLPKLVATDKFRFIQVINNLIYNSSKFTDYGWVILRIKSVGKSIQWTIADTGEGISNACLKVIHKPYQQGQGDHQSKGYGLGMSIAIGIIHSLGGELKIRSSLNKGTISVIKFDSRYANHNRDFSKVPNVTIMCENNFIAEYVQKQLKDAQVDKLPVRVISSINDGFKSHESARDNQIYITTTATSNAPNLIFPVNPVTLINTIQDPFRICIANKKHKEIEIIGNLSILVVDDVKLNQKLIARIFKGTAVSLSFANNGLEAISLVKKYNYDCILMDIEMPIMNGIEATREIRKSYNSKILPIFAVTGNTMDADYKLAMSAGMNDILLKPFEINELFNLLKI